MLLLLDDDTPEPHPDLVAAQHVTSADLMRAGLFPAAPWFAPILPAR